MGQRCFLGETKLAFMFGISTIRWCQLYEQIVKAWLVALKVLGVTCNNCILILIEVLETWQWPNQYQKFQNITI